MPESNELPLFSHARSKLVGFSNITKKEKKEKKTDALLMFDSIIIKRKKKERERRQDERRIPLYKKIVFKKKKTSEEVNLYYRTLAKGSTDIYICMYTLLHLVLYIFRTIANRVFILYTYTL